MVNRYERFEMRQVVRIPGALAGVDPGVDYAGATDATPAPKSSNKHAARRVGRQPGARLPHRSVRRSVGPVEPVRHELVHRGSSIVTASARLLAEIGHRVLGERGLQAHWQAQRRQVDLIAEQPGRHRAASR